MRLLLSAHVVNAGLDLATSLRRRGSLWCSAYLDFVPVRKDPGTEEKVPCRPCSSSNQPDPLL